MDLKNGRERRFRLRQTSSSTWFYRNRRWRLFEAQHLHLLLFHTVEAVNRMVESVAIPYYAEGNPFQMPAYNSEDNLSKVVAVEVFFNPQL